MSNLALFRAVTKTTRPLALCRMMSEGSDKSGAIREGGGAFAKKEKAVEDQYFYNLQKSQLEGLKGHFQEEIAHHEESIKRHQEAIARHKKRISSIAEQKKKA